MKNLRVAINGFGRIGRVFLRAALRNKINVVAVNSTVDAKTSAHLFKWDSVYGKFEKEVKAEDDKIIIGDKEIKVVSDRNPENLPWKKLDIDVVIESTGVFTNREDAEKHIKAGAKKVIISAPATNPDVTIVPGVNDNWLKKEHKIISTASCTTNCLAPIAKILHENFIIKKGFMSTVHAYTNDQRVLDGTHKDLRRARACALSIIPTTTGATKSVAEVIPELKGKLNGLALRVPVADGSIVDFVAEVEKKTTIEEINKLFKEVSKGKMKGIIEYTEEPIVSQDIIGNPHSAIFDALSTMVLDGNFIKVFAWYDNEYGYCCRMVDVIKMIEKMK
ncbi:MAG: type I glyceraldehyde-3-phosphate dehydrogenase [Candidatus Aenigmatarchaeota archaeon]|nr:type I glyceraldehyde-3-phosphate dehydrogenase [Candidatus Aenigmarchaeota archaeon]